MAFERKSISAAAFFVALAGGALPALVNAQTLVSTASSNGAATALDVLPASDEANYRAAFEAAKTNNGEALEAVLPRIGNGTLKPHVERVRLLSPQAAQDLPAMVAWLERWNDVAGADAIYAKAEEARDAEQGAARLMGVSAASPRLTRPVAVPQRRSMGAMREPSYNPSPAGPGATRADRQAIDAAAQRFYAGQDDVAFTLASNELEGPMSGQAGWIGGLAAFRSGDFAAAQQFFHVAANWASGDDWSRSAGAFWAARAAERLGDQARARGYLEQAASNPLTFYGQLGLARLGRWDTMKVPTVADEQDRSARLLRTDAGVRRAIALVEVGRKADAEAEMLAAWSRGKADDDLGYLSLSRDLGLDDVARRIAQTSPATAIANFYPVPDAIRPTGGEFVIDRAVVLAVMRQESRFDPRAVSYAGARGLMQVMPRTAAWMTGRPELASNPRLLFDQTLNVTLGEAYLEKMMGMGVIGNCLARTFMAYNAGPGSVARWSATVKGGEDTLMFMEAAPSGQARVYAERVLSNLWIYHRRFGQRAPSLEKLARGMMPTYEPQDNPRMANRAPIASLSLRGTSAGGGATDIATVALR